MRIETYMSDRNSEILSLFPVLHTEHISELRLALDAVAEIISIITLHTSCKLSQTDIGLSQGSQLRA